MSYELGAYIDLTYLNRKVVADGTKKSFTQTISQFVEVGTSFSFKGGKAAKKIQVVFA